MKRAEPLRRWLRHHRLAVFAVVAALLLAVALSVWPGLGLLRARAVAQLVAKPPVPQGVALQEAVPFCHPAGQTLRLDWAEPVPRSGLRPAIVLVHGGAWMHGQRDDLRSLMLLLAQQGYVAVNVDYRLAPASRFPAPLEDVKCAVRWLRAQADTMAVDPQRIGAWGHSAGGHLVALLATTTGLFEFEGQGGYAGFDSAVQAALVHGGLHDLAAVHDTPPSMALAAQQGIEALLGSTELDALRRASPTDYASPAAAPLLIVHGEQDAVVSKQQSKRFYEVLQQKKARAELMILPGAGHADLGLDSARAMTDILSFWQRNLRPDQGSAR